MRTLIRWFKYSESSLWLLLIIWALGAAIWINEAIRRFA